MINKIKTNFYITLGEVLMYCYIYITMFVQNDETCAMFYNAAYPYNQTASTTLFCLFGFFLKKLLSPKSIKIAILR